jgi:hypothetical protein
MLDHLPAPEVSTPLFSVIIPLEYHRGQWERCWEGWQAQTLDHDEFEIILVVPADFSQHDKLRNLVGSRARLEYSPHVHDIGLCAAGAATARGTFLFFTESHCWPEPEVLRLCVQAFEANPDWAGLSCRSIRITHNKLSVAEADMYDADIDYGMKHHPWRKILDQCFVTRREPYHQCGGLRHEFGHFSEWLLAARYHAAGHKIGYLPDARFYHYYIGVLPELKAFTLDFVTGEISYFSQGAQVPGSDLLEVPPEWACRENFDAGAARAILRMILRDLVAANVVGDGRWQSLRAIGRWIFPAISGDGLTRAVSAAASAYAYLAMRLAVLVGTREQLGRSLKAYIGALIRQQRLNRIRIERLAAPSAVVADAGGGSGTTAAVANQTGFHLPEQYQGRHFRWSETEAVICIRARPGRLILRMTCAQVRSLSHSIDLRFYCDGRRIPDGAISIGAEGFEIRVIIPQSGTAMLGWLCRAFPATGDSRRLGLPVAGLELI